VQTTIVAAYRAVCYTPRVSPTVFWLMVGEREYFLPFDEFPWFRGATLERLFEVELLHETHLSWPGLDVDLDLDRIEHPERYPLVARRRPETSKPGGATETRE